MTVNWETLRILQEENAKLKEENKKLKEESKKRKENLSKFMDSVEIHSKGHEEKRRRFEERKSSAMNVWELFTYFTK